MQWMGSHLLVTKLPTHHVCISVSPSIIADGPPLSIDQHLHPALLPILPTQQPEGQTCNSNGHTDIDEWGSYDPTENFPNGIHDSSVMSYRPT